MKRTLAMMGCLMLASASFGADGQHTGVGGNPNTPPPNSSSSVLPPSRVQMIVIPGLPFVVPEWSFPEAAEQTQPSGENVKTKKTEQAGPSSAQ